MSERAFFSIARDSVVGSLLAERIGAHYLSPHICGCTLTPKERDEVEQWLSEQGIPVDVLPLLTYTAFHFACEADLIALRLRVA